MVLPFFLAVSDSSSVSAEKTRQFPSIEKLDTSKLSPQLLAQKERKTALVIGNGDYGTEGKLSNPPNDAADVTKALEDLGFEVILIRNADKQKIEESINQFNQRLRRGGVGVFYYAGHGVQVGGENYLIPIRAKIDREGDVPYEAIPLGKVVVAMNDAGNPVNLLLIDACRNNPYSRGWRDSSRGLAPLVVQAQGIMISFATAPGKVAADGGGRNSPYTASLLRYIQEPGLPVEIMFKRMRQSVLKETGGKQIPWEQNNLVGDFTFQPTKAVPPIAVATPTVQPATNPDLFKGPSSTPSTESPPSPQVNSTSSSPVSSAKQERIVQQLRPVPVFTIANAQGAPLVASPSNGQKGSNVAGVFISQKDAQDFLNSLKTKKPDLARNVKVTPVSLAEVYQLNQTNKGKPGQLDFAYVPSKQQVDTAVQLLRQGGRPATPFNGTPLFVARGGKDKGYLTIQQDGKSVIPMFFNKEELQSLVDRFKQQQPSMASSIEIQVLNLEGLLDVLRTKDDPQLAQLILVPPQESISFVKQIGIIK